MTDLEDRYVHEALDLAAAGMVNPRVTEKALNAYWSLSKAFFAGQDAEAYMNFWRSEVQYSDAEEARSEGVATCGERIVWCCEKAAIQLRKFDAVKADMKETRIGACLERLVADGWSVDEVSETLRALQFRARRRDEDEPLSGEPEARKRLMAKRVRVGSPPFVCKRGERVTTWIKRSIGRGSNGEIGSIHRVAKKQSHTVDVEEIEVQQTIFDMPEESAAREQLIKSGRSMLAMLPTKHGKRKQRLAMCYWSGMYMPLPANRTRAASEHERWIKNLAEHSGLHPHEIKQIKQKARKAAKTAEIGEGLQPTTIAMLFGVSESYARKLISQGLETYGAGEPANVSSRAVRVPTQGRRGSVANMAKG